MNGGDKPFICTNEGCNMTFSNEDHLNVHHKKHDMVLNLGLAKTPTIADQTPTPTRFIRNCEEVGLFQDLQNVNPFEETFRKAVENSKSGMPHVPELISEDTLHTPQIFDTATRNFPPKYEQDDIPEDFSLHSVIQLQDITKTDNSENGKTYEDNMRFDPDCIDSSSSDSCEIITPDITITDNTESHHNHIVNNNINNVSSKKLDVKTELKMRMIEVLQKRKVEENNIENGHTGYRFGVSVLRPEVDVKMCASKQKSKTRMRDIDIYDKDVSEADKRRLMNRMAQMRSRERKKAWLHQMKEEIAKLRADNKYLLAENKRLKVKNTCLKALLLKQDNCPTDFDLLEKQVEKQSEESKQKKFKPIKPRPTVASVAAALDIKHLPNSQSIIKMDSSSLQQTHCQSPKIIELPATSGDIPVLLPKPVFVTTGSAVRNTPVIKHTSVIPQQTVLTPIVTSQTPVLAKTLSAINLNNDSPMLIQLNVPQAVVIGLKPAKRKC